MPAGKDELRHGGDRQRLDLTRQQLAKEAPDDRLLDLDEALTLSRGRTAVAAVVKLRYFAGLTIEEAAAASEHLRANRQSPLGLRQGVAVPATIG